MKGSTGVGTPARRGSAGDGTAGNGTAVSRGESLGKVLPWSGRSGTGTRKRSRYDDAFDRALSQVVRRHPDVDRERVSAARRTHGLAQQPPGRRSLLLRNHPDFGGWWLAAMLADEADGRRRRDPEAALQLAHLATEVAHAIDPGPDETPEPPLVEDVTARSWRALADAQRRAGDLDAATLSLARARRHLRRGTREPLERAALLESTGRLLAARGRDRGRTFLEAAATLYEDLGEDPRAGRCRLALLLLQPPPRDPAQRRLQALDLRQGLGMLEAAAEPELATAARRRLASLAGGPEPTGREAAATAPARPDPAAELPREPDPEPSAGPACGALGC